MGDGAMPLLRCTVCTNPSARPPRPCQPGVTQVRVAAAPQLFLPWLGAPARLPATLQQCRELWPPREPRRGDRRAGGAAAQQGNGGYLLRQLCNRFFGGADCKLQS